VEERDYRDAKRAELFDKGQSKRIWGELYKVLDCSDVVIQVHTERKKEREKRRRGCEGTIRLMRWECVAVSVLPGAGCAQCARHPLPPPGEAPQEERRTQAPHPHHQQVRDCQPKRHSPCNLSFLLNMVLPTPALALA
jgi:hypothetical protein